MNARSSARNARCSGSHSKSMTAASGGGLRLWQNARRVSVRFELLPDHPHVALVTIDRPERANALDPPTLRELAAAWQRIAGDDEIRCAVLTGAGERVFCSGMDMRTTIVASQRLARGGRIDPADFEGLRAIGTAGLRDLDLAQPLA